MRILYARFTLRGTLAAAAVVALCTVFGADAEASCVSNRKHGAFTPQWSLATIQSGPHASGPGDGGSIVGLWKVKLYSDNLLIDWGFDQWHSDGLELLVDLYAPATGNVCVGTWKKTGPQTYKLKHFGMVFDLGGNFIGTSQLLEEVTLDQRGANYTGKFVSDFFDITGVQDPTQHVVGTIAAERITAD